MSKWETYPLASLCTVFDDGDWIESKDQSPNGVRLVQTGNVGEGRFKDRAEKARFVSLDTFKRLRCTEIFVGDCLISRLPDPVGRACLIPETGERMITAVDCTIVRFDQSKVLPEYFTYYSQAGRYLDAVEREATGTTRKRISRARLAQVPIPLAPLPEQHRIVAVLDEAFEGIATAKANAEKNLQNARELFGRISGVALDQIMPVSRIARLEEVVEPDCSLSYGIVQPGEEFADGLPIVRPVDLNCSVVVLDGLKRIDPTLAKSYARTMLKGNDILLCVRGTTGTLAIADPTLAGGNVTRGIVPIRFDARQVSQDFGYCLMRSEPVQMQIRAKTYGTALMQINIRDLRQLTLPIPPRQEQEFIVKRLGDVEFAADQLIETFERKVAALNELKKSLLNQAFSGAL